MESQVQVMGAPGEPTRERWWAPFARWTRPPDELTDPEERRRNRMLRSVSLALALQLSLAAVVSAITSSLFPNRGTSLGWGGTLVVALAAVAFWIAFWLSTRPGDRLGGWVTLITIDLFLLALAPFFKETSATLAIGFAVPVLCATLFLDIRGTLGIFAVSMVCLAVHLVIAKPSVAEASFIGCITVVVIIMGVLVAYLREDDLAKVRRLRAFEQRDAERLRGELELAQKVQRAMLPAQLPIVNGLGLATHSEAAFEASGDFYDAFEIGDDEDRRIGIVVCDVAGKGVASALIMSATRAALRAEAQGTASPGDVLAKVNNTLATSVPKGLFVTIFYGIYDPGTRRLRFSSAGHPHPLRGSVHHDDVAELESYGLPLGLVADTVYEDRTTQLDAGDFVLVYTDGLVEALDTERSMYGFDAVRLHLGRAGSSAADAGALVEHSLAGMREFIGGERLHDDVTIVALCVEDVTTGGPDRDDRVAAWTSER